MIIRRFFLLLGFLFPVVGAFTQNLNSFDQQAPFIDASFRKTNLIIESGRSFFNVLVIRNMGEAEETVFVDINVPVGWSVMDTETLSYDIQPSDSVLIPIRAAPSKEVEGEIGYSVIAAITDRNGDTYTNAYCFVKIPKKSDLRFQPLTRVSFFDQQTGDTELSFLLSNRGNVNELVYLNFRSTNNILLQGEKENMLAMDIMVNAKSDTTVTIPVQLNEKDITFAGSLYRADLEGFTEDYEFATSFWFNKLSNTYKYIVPESEKMLVTEIAAQNLLSNQSAILAGGVRGNVLFNENRDLNYGFYRYGAGPSDQFLRYSRIRIEYNTPEMNASIGDVSFQQLKFGGGKGGMFSYKFADALKLSVMGSQNLFRPITSYGATIEENFTPWHLSSFYAHSRNDFFDNIAHVGGAGAFLKLFANHTLRINTGISQVNYNQNNNSLLGYGLNLEYYGKINNTVIRLREQYGSSNYYGHYSGRHSLNGRIFHPISDEFQIEYNLNDHSYRPLVESDQGINDQRYTQHLQSNLLLRRILDNNLSIYAGPVFERKATNIFFLFEEDDSFVTNAAKLNIGGRINDGNGLNFSPNLTFGYTFVTRFSTPQSDLFTTNLQSRPKEIFNAHMSVNLRKDFWGTFINYFYGPFSVNQEISQFYYNISSHSIRLMPYLERFVYKDVIKLNSRVGLLYDFGFRTSRFNINNQLDIFLKNDFTIHLLNTFSYQLTTDQLTDERYSYSNNYFEVRLVKEFNWNQPRVKYYDLTINLFKDQNGNLRRDFNEPGVKDILVSISSLEPFEYEDFDVDYNYSGKMVSTQLLTSMNGEVTYENLTKGLYRIELKNIGKEQDKFFPDQNEFIINVDEDKTEFIPYLERNRIFGKIVMNRSKLSNLGRIEIGNIKITAEDSQGRTVSTLTDENGNFEMYVPSIDSYIVSVNNIFQEHFELRQNNFRADLNGFKQFEVTFVFDEIRRSIEFAPPEVTETPSEIRRMGRTNLSGLVRDASSLQPVRANVEVIDTETGSVIASTVSDRSTGRYSTSFSTGEEYVLIVSANGYWMNSQSLILDQFLTIQDVERDVLLERITVGARFQLNNLLFDMRSSEIPTEALPELDRVIEQLKQNPNVRIRIEGHADPLEHLENNQLSEERASAVRNYMIENGFSNIEVAGLGDSQPIAPNNNENNRSRNRRVEIIIIDR